MIALIDADLVAYRSAASCQSKDKETGEIHIEPLEIAIQRCDSLMRQLLQETNAEKYQAFLSTSANFRKEINSEYKANRTQEPPQWLQQCKEFLITEWNAKVKEFYEADDLLGINQTEDSIIISLDKDLKMIPGEHYSWEISGTTITGAKWTKDAEFTTTTTISGLHAFYIQMLVGDATDNVIGIADIGPVKAKKALSICDNEQEMFDLVYDKYNDPHRFLMNGACLWICQEEGVAWPQHLKDSALTIPNELKPVVQQQNQFLNDLFQNM